jgi:hypothetical protein
MTKNIWGSPFATLRKPREPKEKTEPSREPKEKPKKIPRLSRADVRLLLDCPASSINETLIVWVERWMTQLIQEKAYPPHLSRAGSYQYLLDFLGEGATEVLNTIRRDHYGTQRREDAGVGEFDFLMGVPMVV